MFFWGKITLYTVQYPYNLIHIQLYIYTHTCIQILFFSTASSLEHLNLSYIYIYNVTTFDAQKVINYVTSSDCLLVIKKKKIPIKGEIYLKVSF